MSKPNYRVVISFDGERKTYTARVPELAHCTAEGATRAEAMSQLEQELEAILAGLASQGKLPPPAIDDAFGIRLSGNSDKPEQEHRCFRWGQATS